MTTMMEPEESPRPLVQLTTGSAQYAQSQVHRWISPVDAHAIGRLRSLADIQGLEPVRVIASRFGVAITAHGSLLTRLAVAPTSSIHDLVPFLSDLDLAHDGTPAQTAELLAAILTEIPFADAMRIQLRDRELDKHYRIAAAFSGIVPALTLRLGIDGGIEDGWGGIRDIASGEFRYIRNGFYRDSPLYRSGRDLEVFSALLYLRTLASCELSTAPQPGFDDALEVLRDGVRADEVLSRIAKNPALGARLVYLLSGLRAAMPSWDEFGAAFDELRSFLQYCSQHPALREAIDAIAAPLSQPGASLTVSAHLGSLLFRLPASGDELWSVDEADGYSALSSAVDDFRSAAGTNAINGSQMTLDEGLTIVAASPWMKVRPGSSSSSLQPGVGHHEFVHSLVLLDPADTSDETKSDDFAVLAGLRQNQSMTWLTNVPSHCAVRRVGHSQYMFVRANLGGMCEDVANAELRLFVVRWNGRESVLREA